jgi:hypothetical protein
MSKKEGKLFSVDCKVQQHVDICFGNYIPRSCEVARIDVVHFFGDAGDKISNGRIGIYSLEKYNID